MTLQPIIDLAAICAKKGIKNAILSPGSRCAPITLAFARHPEMHCRTISDERSAAFIALGMAQQLKKPVVLVCTSGTAALNYAPAIAEAYFQQIPLLVVTADRPKEWIDQWDGQTIRQEKLYGQHIKKDYVFPTGYSLKDEQWHAHRISNEAINAAMAFPQGPVHINIPLREPFYPENGEDFNYSNNIKLVQELRGTTLLPEEGLIKVKNALDKFQRILIVPGQQSPNENIGNLLNQLAKDQKAVVVTDTICNLQSKETINFHDQFLQVVPELDSFKPDLIISFGKSIISKSLKQFLRSSSASHWHIQPEGYFPDTYQSLSCQIHTQPEYFLQFLLDNLKVADQLFIESWKEANYLMGKALEKHLSNAPFGEWKAIFQALKHIPAPSKMHLANSMAVRYVNFLGPRKQEIICNRGTSGIDGSNSMAVGCTFTTKEFVTLITGDMAFFYDRNAYWHNYPVSNLRVILLNNHAGGIFRIIDGPSKQPELEEFFETQQALNAEHLAKEFGFRYYTAQNESEVEEVMEQFYHPSIHPKILEISTDSKTNTGILKTIKRQLKEEFILFPK
ncbi:2-succinyl-5-enolpyruvyl-6-hydroxy-3-cyclohexene-1-carboxylic-acid synthase [Echinicola jeungdonensis]|uniref:2-succinyl-5-enolpyruvyl-6-hydroxy-3-cyclohexene-1-carboxylate synthase n=1 Tax=Echinicola jeungdonensis TaxID=709343 RepID=A0ABV5J4F3_9BACT|nr:2-succinyl-5-enolpyruvyl-6-hydroxy-3-cyclohexene-1-carboxylic-acid synthase [Echinicola jeungdonensis]MDN3670098.1 2-succinyl-5-enolpyruvyl-6-hydroxy-3-cyclohexene-1-carboxylic-acid synthase [Echinicola jeungdonensis]